MTEDRKFGLGELVIVNGAVPGCEYIRYRNARGVVIGHDGDGYDIEMLDRPIDGWDLGDGRPDRWLLGAEQVSAV